MGATIKNPGCLWGAQGKEQGQEWALVAGSGAGSRDCKLELSRHCSAQERGLTAPAAPELVLALAWGRCSAAANCSEAFLGVFVFHWSRCESTHLRHSQQQPPSHGLKFFSQLSE